MARTLIQLQNPDHWKWKANKDHDPKIRIRGKLRKWLKKYCPNFVLMKEDMPPAVWIDKEEADHFKKDWL